MASISPTNMPVKSEKKRGWFNNFFHENQITLHSFDQGTLIQQIDLPLTLEEMPFVFTDFRKKLNHTLK